MIGDLIPMVVMTGMFAMIFGIAYVRSRENMAMIEKGLNPRNKDVRPRPFINLKWGLLLIGSGFGLLFAYIIDRTIIKDDKHSTPMSITIGGHHSKEKKEVVVINDTSRLAKDTAVLEKTTSAKHDNANDDGDDEDEHSITHISNDPENPALYLALVAIGGGLGLFFSYRIEKKEWLDKKIPV